MNQSVEDVTTKKLAPLAPDPVLKLSARACEVHEISFDTGEQFVAYHHNQGSAKSANSIYLGLFFEGSIVGAVQFGQPRTSKKKREYSRELVRLCFKKNVRVRGGASKLIKAYIRDFSPEDIFTYQDTSGEATAVYEHAGFVLVESKKEKQYLVAPGKTLRSAGKKERFSIAEVARRGPDALLGVKLGEIFDKDGTRKTNPRIFTEELGWHVETTSGDRVYEWVDPHRTYYTYKVTASDSDKYYFGVSHVKEKNASLENCLKDGYYGSGGVKFKNWKQQHFLNLEKEILAVWPSRKSALKHEARLIKNKHIDDPLCLNSVAGGQKFINSMGFYSSGLCTTHGEVTLRLDKCIKCSIDGLVAIKECHVHGDTLHWAKADVCFKCSASKIFTFQHCPIHGESKFRGDLCGKCSSSKGEQKLCPIHGLVTHRHGNCQSCKNKKVVSLRECNVHGLVNHQGEQCCKCIHENLVSSGLCLIHGEVKLRAGACPKCSTSQGMNQKGLCPVHGEAKFQHGKCCKCSTTSNILLKDCNIHGLTKHRGDNCYKCRVAKSISIKTCSTHGEAKHRGSTCISCSNSKPPTAS